MVCITDIAPRFSSLSSSQKKTPSLAYSAQHRIITYINHLNNNVIHKRLSSNTSTKKQERKIFLSDCFNHLRDMLSMNQHNHALQHRIEKYLFDKQHVYMLESIKKGINYRTETSKYIVDQYDKYCVYLKAFLDNFNTNSTIFNGLDYREKNLEYFKQVLEIIGEKEVASLAFYHVIKFISNVSNDTPLISINCESVLGKNIVEKAIYTLYSEYIKSFKNKKDSAILTLKEWKNNNKELIEPLLESTFYVPTGKLLLYYFSLDMFNILEYVVEYSDEGKQQSYIKFTEEARKHLITDNKVSCVPTKLPMIVPPKMFSLNKDDEIVLGVT